MTGFLRALRGEIHLLLHWRGFRIALLLVVAATLVKVAADAIVIARWGEGLGLGRIQLHFWRRFAQGLRVGLLVTEMATLVLVAGRLPREIASGAARDPLVRRISRPAFILARACVSLLVPLVLGLAALLSSAALAGVLFDAGHVAEPPAMLLDPDPEVEAAFQAWAEERGMQTADVAAFRKLQEERGLGPEEAARSLGVEPFELPPEFEPYVPILYFLKSEVRSEILAGALHGLLPLLCLACFALAVSVLLPSGVLASGLAFGSVLAFGITLAPQLGEGAWWVFANWLPGLGHGMGAGSELAKASTLAEGIGEAVTPEAVLRAGTLGSLMAGAAFLILVLAAFRRRRI